PVRWYADPSGASDIAELVCAGFHVSADVNSIRPGIATVTARLESNRLRIVAGACPNLLPEAELYRYSNERTDRRSETPLDNHNHALDALRYLVSKIDYRRMARLKGPGAGKTSAAEATTEAQKPPPKWLSVWNEELWRHIE